MISGDDSPEALAAWLAAIVGSSDDAIVSKTFDGVITSWNAGAERIFGYTAAEAIGQHITLIVPRELHAEEEQVLARIRRGERVDHFETTRQTKSGRRISVSLTVSPVRDSRGRAIGASKIARDITERRALEAERDALLERERQARSEAEALNRSQDQFLAVLSHELRTPLNAIFGWASMLRAGELDPATMRRATEAILRNARAQVQLIDDLLDMSRIITGNMRIEPRPVDLTAVIDNALDTVRPAANAKGIRLSTVLDPRAGIVLGAADRLQQVVWNLLMNAVKFTPKGGQVQVGLQRFDSHVEVVVQDTGEGIPADLLPYIFDRFRQGDSSSSRRHGGLGIGLALVRHLVELHGGTVAARSAGPGQGSTFTVGLPVSLVEPPPQAEAGPAFAAEMERAPSLAGLRVLVVDDDRDGLELMGTRLAKAGAQVRTGASAAEGFETDRAWSPDVVLTDIQMPEEDGFALIRRIRQFDAASGRRTPVIALTAYGTREDRVRSFAAGFHLHLVKPISPEELTLSIANVAGRTG